MEASVAARLAQLRRRIRRRAQRSGRAPDGVRLLAVSKGHGERAVREAQQLGLRDFGENRLQPAQAKIAALADLPLRWHFIGAVQSRKAAGIARSFDWVHSLSRVDIAERLHRARPDEKGPLNVCVQVKIDDEDSKSGINEEDLMGFIESIRPFSRLRLRGLMTMPAQRKGFDAQRAPFRRLRLRLQEAHRMDAGLDTLSMGTSGDFEAAVAEGATWIRVGTALFGPRE